MITLEELKERLMQLDETLLIERLEITSEDIVHRFSDIIENNYHDLTGEFDDSTPWDQD
jgi:hypothetical protein